MRRRDDAGKAAARWPYRWRSGARPGNEAAWRARTVRQRRDFGQVMASGGSRARCSAWRCWDDHGVSGALWRCRARGSAAAARRPSAAHGTPGGDGALMSGPSAEREKLTGGTLRQI
jgi:hypothetical protein